MIIYFAENISAHALYTYLFVGLGEASIPQRSFLFTGIAASMNNEDEPFHFG